VQALFMACQRKARDLSASGSSGTQVTLHKKNIGSLVEFSGDLVDMALPISFLPIPISFISNCFVGIILM
jgi:hypothetical protein